MKKYLIIILLYPNFLIAQNTFQTTFGPGAWKAIVTLPFNYATRTDSVPGVLFIPGAGEIGTGYAGLDLFGPHARMIGGWNGSVTLPSGGVIYPIIISLEPNTDFATNGEFTRIVMDTIMNRYRIRRNSVHVTGFSAGSFAWKILATEDVFDDTAPYGPFTYADLMRSILDIQGVLPDDNPDHVNRARNFARNRFGGKYLGIWGTGDGIRGIDQFSNSMNVAVAGSGRFFSTSDGHNSAAWDRIFGSRAGSVPEKFMIDGVHQDGYTWMIRQGDTSLYAQANLTPTVLAGADQSITLPNSTVTLSGSASDGDGTISSYLWTKQSGPSGGAISSAASPNTGITGLLEGVYLYRLTATDNSSGSSFDEMQITVNPAPVVQGPINSFRSLHKFINPLP